MFQLPGPSGPSLLHPADEKDGQNPAQDVKDMQIRVLTMPDCLKKKRKRTA
jgi:hypothetical protein